MPHTIVKHILSPLSGHFNRRLWGSCIIQSHWKDRSLERTDIWRAQTCADCSDPPSKKGLPPQLSILQSCLSFRETPPKVMAFQDLVHPGTSHFQPKWAPLTTTLTVELPLQVDRGIVLPNATSPLFLLQVLFLKNILHTKFHLWVCFQKIC